MVLKNTFFLVSVFLLSVVHSQNIKKKDTVFLRYNGEVSKDFRFNTIKLYSLKSDSVYEVTEIYRFTEPLSLKSQHQENLNRVYHGSFSMKYSNGEIVEKGTYNNGQKNGEWETYKEGKLTAKTPYKNGKKEGLAYYYYLGDNYYTGNWENDEITGKKVKYNEDGNLIFEGEYDHGKLKGTNIWYYPNGNIEKEANYSEGELHGKFSSKYSNGGLQSEGFYNKDNRIGSWVWYRENGKIASKEEYTNKGKVKKALFYDYLGNETNGKRQLLEGVVTERRRLNRLIKKHVADNFSYPKEMEEKGFEGRIYLFFKIDKNGNVTDLEARGDAHKILIEKAKEIIKSLPQQEPARVHNVLTEIRFSIPIVFQINR